MTTKEPRQPPKGAYCTHARMQYRSCGDEGGMCKAPCRVECPDCGLFWLFEDGSFESIESGTVIVAPKGVNHAIENLSKNTMKWCFCFNPPVKIKKA